MKTKDAYTELSVQLARIENKLDLLLEQNKPIQNTIPTIGYTGCARCGKWQCLGNCSSSVGAFGNTAPSSTIKEMFEASKSIFDDLIPKDATVELGCSDYRGSLMSTSGSFLENSYLKREIVPEKVDEEAWTNTIAGKLQE